jgi:purine-binding chemotaxis protein CheW
MGTMTAVLERGFSQQKADPRAGKYLMFWLGSEEFAIQVLRVREIMGVREINTVPQTPAYVKGVINLRGQVDSGGGSASEIRPGAAGIHAADVRIVVQIEVSETDSEGEGRHVEIGAIVDQLSEVLTLQAGDIENTPDSGSGVAIPYLLGMAKIKGKVKILLDINRVLPVQEAAGLGSL